MIFTVNDGFIFQLAKISIIYFFETTPYNFETTPVIFSFLRLPLIICLDDPLYLFRRPLTRQLCLYSTQWRGRPFSPVNIGPVHVWKIERIHDIFRLVETPFELQLTLLSYSSSHVCCQYPLLACHELLINV